MAKQHTHSLMVRFFDCDMLGHTNNAVYFTYIEEARMSFFAKLGYTQKNFQKECPIILAEESCQFKSPSYLHENLDVETTVSELKDKSFILNYKITEQKTGRLVAQAKTTQVGFDYQNKKTMALPGKLKARLISFS